MSQGKRDTMVVRAAKKGGSVATRFFLRFLIWGAIIAVLAETTSGLLWGRVYSEFGLPLGIGEASTYRAVLFGAGVASVVGGAAVAIAGMVWRA